MTETPGTFGPYPFRSLAKEAAEACPVTPCQDPPSAMTSYPPVTSLAMRSAASLLSDPVLTKSERLSGPGSQSSSFLASLATDSGIMPEKR